MSSYRLTFYWTHAGFGGSETWVTPDVSGAAAQKAVQDFLDFRKAILPASWGIQGVRVSEYGSKRVSRVLIPGENVWPVDPLVVTVPYNGTLDDGSITKRADQTRAVLQFALLHTNQTKAVQRYLSGIPDALSGTEPGTVVPGSAPVFWTALGLFWKFLGDAHWQIEVKSAETNLNTFPVKRVTIAESAPANLGLWLPAIPDPAIDVGDKIQVTGFKRKPFSGATINGKWYVDAAPITVVNGLRVYYLRDSAGVDVGSIKLLGRVRKSSKSLVSIGGFVPVRVGIHKRGKPGLTPRGRRLTRVSLDP